MEERRQIRIDSSEEECIDLSLSKTPASQLLLLMQAGLNAVAHDINNGQRHLNTLKGMLKKDTPNYKPGELEAMIKDTDEKLDMARGIHETGLKFYNDLQQILKELYLSEEKKSLIIKPNWMGQ